jgi:hypothetical protein
LSVIYDDASNLEREPNDDLDAACGGGDNPVAVCGGGDNLVAASKVIESDDESGEKKYSTKKSLKITSSTLTKTNALSFGSFGSNGFSFAPRLLLLLRG